MVSVFIFRTLIHSRATCEIWVSFELFLPNAYPEVSNYLLKSFPLLQGFGCFCDTLNFFIYWV